MKMPILNILFHPIRSFREDLRTNPLSRWTWGVEPANRKRRRRADINIGIHMCSYILCFLLFLFLGIRVTGGPSLYQAYQAGHLGSVTEISVVSAVFSLLIWCVLLLVIRAFNNSCARKLKANWEDYHLAGISGSQMLWGLGGSGIVGVFAAIAVHGIVFTAAVRVP